MKRKLIHFSILEIIVLALVVFFLLTRRIAAIGPIEVFGIILAYVILKVIISLFRRKAPVASSNSEEQPALHQQAGAQGKEKKEEKKLPKVFREGIRGVARDVRPGASADMNEQILGFRLERVDAEGNVVQLLPVEVRGREVPEVFVSEGDSIIVVGKLKRKGILRARRLYNLTTNADLKIGGSSFVDAILEVTVFLLFIPAVLGIPAGALLALDENELGIPIAVGSVFLLIILVFIMKKRKLK